jgi:glycosyltransferase involved in cell wall biosynthesis
MTKPTAAIPTVVAALHDGFYSCGTGAGRSNRAFLEILTRILRPGTRLAVLPIHLSPASGEYDPGRHAQTRTLIEQAGGKIFPASNGTHGQARFGGLPNFRAACMSAARIINHRLVPHAGPLLIVAFDVPFFGLTHSLVPAARPSLVVVPRSTAALHAPGDGNRLAWERAGLHATVDTGGRIAAISAHMRHHLTTGYAIPAAKLVSLPDGLTQTEREPAMAPEAGLLPAPAQRGFLLAMGRAVDYKGFDDLIDALTILKAAGATLPHTVIAAVTDAGPPTPYQEHLARKIATAGVNATLLTRYDPALRNLLAHPALTAVVIPSRSEPFGRIPLEAFAAGAAPVVATTAGGLAEQVTDGQNGYTAQPSDPRSLAAALHKALTCTPAEQARLRAAGRRTLTHHRYEATTERFLATVAPWATTSNPAAPSQ